MCRKKSFVFYLSHQNLLELLMTMLEIEIKKDIMWVVLIVIQTQQNYAVV